MGSRHREAGECSVRWSTMCRGAGCSLRYQQAAAATRRSVEGSRGVKFMGMVNKHDPPAASQPHLC